MIAGDAEPGLCRVVRGTPGFRKLPVFLYGPSDPDLEARAMAAGATGYIPFRGQSVRIVDSMFGSMPELPEGAQDA